MTPPLTPFGDRLVAALHSKNVSDSELAKKLGIAQPNIHTLKYKTESPRRKTVMKIAKALKVPVESLLPVHLESSVVPGMRVFLVIENGKNRTTMRLA